MMHTPPDDVDGGSASVAVHDAGGGMQETDREEQLATRAAWLYFIGNSTQAQIAKKLGLTRLRVNRLLAQAREQGLVQIQVTGRLASCVALEHALVERYGLKEAVVVPSPAEASQLRPVIAAAAGHYLSRHLHDGMSVGVGWGRTLRLSLSAVARKSYRRLSVVSLIGGLTQSSAVNPHETASHLADIIGGQCYYFAGPAFTDSAESRDMLMNQPMLRDVFERGRSVDLAFLSVGDLAQANTMTTLNLISDAEVKSLQAAGAVGDLCSHWINIAGDVIDHPLNSRAVGLPPVHLKSVKNSILASGGKAKVGVMHGALVAGYANRLLTDEATAAQLLAIPQPAR
jgi:DNA-binding transcriptional regulator LsrR (DeoR family)